MEEGAAADSLDIGVGKGAVGEGAVFQEEEDGEGVIGEIGELKDMAAFGAEDGQFGEGFESAADAFQEDTAAVADLGKFQVGPEFSTEEGVVDTWAAAVAAVVGEDEGVDEEEEEEFLFAVGEEFEDVFIPDIEVGFAEDLQFQVREILPGLGDLSEFGIQGGGEGVWGGVGRAGLRAISAD